ncbi:glycosyltransferase, partial [Klebsiella pneumoniae]|uniref:glycosyltransferase n=3 Tax=Klebsiella pneumoniae TaxID=573 RepID=UPI001D0DBF1D
VKTGNNARNGGKNSLNRLIRCVCGKKIGPDPRNFNQRVSLGRNDLLIRTFPKYSEGVPRIIIEACAMGRSCIVGNVPGCKAIIKDNFNGCVLKTHSASEIAEKIEYLRDNMEIRKKFGLRSAEIVKERFSKEIVIDKTLCVYNKILSTTKR